MKVRIDIGNMYALCLPLKPLKLCHIECIEDLC